MKVLVIGTVVEGEQVKTRNHEGKEEITSVRHKVKVKPASQFEFCKPVEVEDEQAVRLIDAGAAFPADKGAIKQLEKVRERQAREARADWPEDAADADEQVDDELDTEGQQGDGALKPPSVPVRGRDGEPRVSEPDRDKRSPAPGVETVGPGTGPRAGR